MATPDLSKQRRFTKDIVARGGESVETRRVAGGRMVTTSEGSIFVPAGESLTTTKSGLGTRFTSGAPTGEFGDPFTRPAPTGGGREAQKGVTVPEPIGRAMIEEQAQRGFLERIAQIGLTPVAIGANIIGGILQGLGVGYTKQTAKELAQTTVGKLLGTSIVATAAALTGVVGAKAIAGVTATGTITSTTQLGYKIPTVTTRAFVGKSSTAAINKLFSGVRPVAMRFATNGRTIAASTSFLSRIGLTNPATLLAVIGSYPFAGFIKEEAMQITDFGINSAIQNKDLQGLQMAIQEKEEILDVKVWERIFQAVPFVNVVKQLKDYFGAARMKLQIDKQILAGASLRFAEERTTEAYWQKKNIEELAGK